MASCYVETRHGKRGDRHRAVLEWWVDGKRRRHREPWTRYWKKAHQKSQELLGDAEDVKLGLRKAAPARDWGQLRAEYERFSRGELRPRTWSGWHKPMLDHFSRYLKEHAQGESTRLGAVTTKFVTDFRYHLESPAAAGGRGLARNSVGGYGRHLTAVFNYAIRTLKWISENPCVGVPWPKYEPTGRDLEDDVLTAVMTHARDRLRALIWIDRHSGARSGELVNLDHRQLNRAGSYLTIVMHKRRGIRGGWQPKTAASTRQVPILPDLWPLFGPAKKDGAVFDGYTGTPDEKVNQVSKDFRRARKAAIAAAIERGDQDLATRLADATFHDVKHTFCTDYLVKGGSTAKLSEITGTSEATLKKTYSHLLGKVTLADMSIISRGPLPKLPPSVEPQESVRNAEGRFSRR